MESQKELFIGIDIGGTNTKIGLVDLRGNIISLSSIPTHQFDNPEAYFTSVCNALDAIASQSKKIGKIAGIGIGAPCANPISGIIEDAANISWLNGFNVEVSLSSIYNIPVKLDNDANAAAKGEMIFGGAQTMKEFMVITLGTGLGSGIVSNGRLVYGRHGLAGEIGHTIIVPNGRKCGCGRRGCLETYVSGTGIVRTVAELMADEFQFESELANIPFNKITAKQVAKLAKQGDAIAFKAFEKAGKTLGFALANSVAYFEPQTIFLTGGLTQGKGLLLKHTIKAFEANLLNIYQNEINIQISELPPNNAAVLGAAALVFNMQSPNKPDFQQSENIYS